MLRYPAPKNYQAARRHCIDGAAVALYRSPPSRLLPLNNNQAAMLNTKGMHFPIEVILVCIRWYLAHPLSYRHLGETMQERGVAVDQSSVNLWAVRFLPLLEK
jgi:hypothetical protein